MHKQPEISTLSLKQNSSLSIIIKVFGVNIQLLFSSEIALKRILDNIDLSQISFNHDRLDYKVLWLEPPQEFKEDWVDTLLPPSTSADQYGYIVNKKKFLLQFKKGRAIVHSPYNSVSGLIEALEIIIQNLLQRKQKFLIEGQCLINKDHRADLFVGWKGFLHEVIIPYEKSQKCLNGNKSILFANDHDIQVSEFKIEKYNSDQYKVKNIFLLTKEKEEKINFLGSFGSCQIFHIGCVVNKKMKTYSIPLEQI